MCFVKEFGAVMTLVLTKIFGLSSENKTNKPRESIWFMAASMKGDSARSSLCGGD